MQLMPSGQKVLFALTPECKINIQAPGMQIMHGK